MMTSEHQIITIYSTKQYLFIYF